MTVNDAAEAEFALQVAAARSGPVGIGGSRIAVAVAAVVRVGVGRDGAERQAAEHAGRNRAAAPAAVMPAAMPAATPLSAGAGRRRHRRNRDRANRRQGGEKFLHGLTSKRRIPQMSIQRPVSPGVPKKANTSKCLDEQPMNANAAMLPQCGKVSAKLRGPPTGVPAADR